jgi:CMP-N-acetylneuraminic acid synthetase
MDYGGYKTEQPPTPSLTVGLLQEAGENAAATKRERTVLEDRLVSSREANAELERANRALREDTGTLHRAMKRLEGDTMLPFHADLPMASRRQDNVPAYFPYGVGYIVATETLYALRTFYPPRATFFEIKRYQCFEIDDLCDFLVVETVMKQEWNPQ